MSERYKLPKRSWFVPFGPIRDVDLIKIDAINFWRQSCGAKFSHGRLLLKLEQALENASQVTSQIEPPRENCTYWMKGKRNSEKWDKPGLLFVIRDGAIISVKQVNRQDWEAMP